MVSQSIWVPSLVAVLLGVIAATPYFSIQYAPPCTTCATCTPPKAPPTPSSSSSQGSDDISLAASLWHAEVGRFIDITNGANASMACANPLKYFSNRTLAASLHALIPLWRQVATNVTFRGWGWRNLSSDEDVLCRQRTYDVICGDAIRSLMGLQMDELYNYGLEIGEEQLFAARVYDGPYIATLRAKQQLIAMENERLLNQGTIPICSLHITFFAMVHYTGPDLPPILMRLLRRVTSNPCHSLLVHVDARAGDAFAGAVRNLTMRFPSVRMTKQRILGTWGGISLVRMELLGIMEALEWHPNTDYIINLSAHDYPIKSDEHIHRFLNDHRGKSFVHIQTSLGQSPLPNKATEYYLDQCSHLPVQILDNDRFDNLRRIQNARGILGRESRYTLGSQWWMIHNSAAWQLLASRSSRVEYMLYGHMHIPDEGFFQSVFQSTASLIDIHYPYNMRIAQLSRGRCKPIISDQLTALNQSRMLFARKLNNITVMDEIDSMVLQQWQLGA